MIHKSTVSIEGPFGGKGTLTMDGARFDRFTRQLATGVDRRRVVKTGVKLAYITPIVLASSQLSVAAANTCCPAGYFYRSNRGDCKATVGPSTTAPIACPNGGGGGGAPSL